MQNITSGLTEVASSPTILSPGPYQIQFTLTGLTATGAGFGVFVRRYSAAGALLMEVGQANVAKQSHAATAWGKAGCRRSSATSATI